MRARRGDISSRRAHELVARDIELLLALARLRVATSRQLARAYFGDPSSFHRRARALASLGYLRVVVCGLNLPNLLVLTTKGARLLESHGQRAEDLHVARTVERLDLHAELIGDLWLGFASLAGSRPGLVDDVLLDHDLRRALGPRARRAYVPDALITLSSGNGASLTIAYEIDRGSESRSVVGPKFTATLDLARNNQPLYGYAPWRPTLLAPTTARVRSLAAEACARGAGDLWAFGLLDVRHEPAAPRYALARDIADADDVASMLRFGLVP